VHFVGNEKNDVEETDDRDIVVYSLHTDGTTVK
jgi:hypothetical protein